MQNKSQQMTPANQPPALQQLLGDRFQYSWDIAIEGKGRHDPWFQILVCRYGEIYRYSNELLAVLVVGAKVVARIRREQDFRIHQDGDDAAVFLFKPEQFETVARYVQPKRRRKLSEHFKERFVAKGIRNLSIVNYKRSKRTKAVRKAALQARGCPRSQMKFACL